MRQLTPLPGGVDHTAVSIYGQSDDKKPARVRKPFRRWAAPDIQAAARRAVELFAGRAKAAEDRVNFIASQRIDNLRNALRFAAVAPLPEAIGKQQPDEEPSHE